MAKKANITDISEMDINALFVKSSDVKSVLRHSKSSFFDVATLNKAVLDMQMNGNALNIDAFWNIAKIGEKSANVDKSHKCYYVTRAVKMELLRIKDASLNLLEKNFNDTDSSKILREKINNKAFKIKEVILNDEANTKALLLDVDFKSAYK
jgi:hypothetical protein